MTDFEGEFQMLQKEIETYRIMAFTVFMDSKDSKISFMQKRLWYFQIRCPNRLFLTTVPTSFPNWPFLLHLKI